MKSTTDLTSTQLNIVDAVNSLPKKLREMIVLRDFNGLSVTQIAFALNMSQESVRKRLAKARLCLQKKLAKLM